MSMKIKTSAGWKNLASLKLKDSNGIWKNIAKAYLKTGNAWKIFFSSITVPTIDTKVTISQSTNSSTGIVTLTGTNYHWSDTAAGTLSLEYWFERSDGTIIGTKHTATNPSSGSSTEYTQSVSSSLMLKNSDTVFTFVVSCTNNTTNQTSTSTSDTTTFNGARNISNLTTGTASYTSIPLTFTPGTYSNSYRVAYTYTGGSGTYDSSGTGSTSKTITVTGLQAGVEYTFTVTPYSGNIVSSAVTGYPGNTSSSVIATTLVGVSPTLIFIPQKPSGTGEYNTDVTIGSAGTYTNKTSVTTSLVYIVGSEVPANGSTTNVANSISSPHTVSQADFTSSSNTFYTQDQVLGVDGTTTYYYYSVGLNAYLSAINDNFNRTNGLITQTSSGLYYNTIYSTFTNSWYTTSNKAWSSQSVSSNSTGNPKMVIESGGKTNITASIQYPETTSAGYGIAFWSTSAGSWWSVSPNCLTSTSTVCGTTYTTGLTSCPTTGSNVGDYCGTCVSYTETATTCDNITDHPGVNTCPAGSCSCTNLAATSPSCTVNVTGAGTCPPSTGTTAGDRCSACSSPTCDGGSARYADNTMGTACGDKCSCTGPFTTSECPYGTYESTFGGVRVCLYISNSSYCCTPTSTTYYDCTKSTCSYTAMSNGTAAGKTYGTSSSGTTTKYKSYKNISQTNYDTYLQIYSSNGSTVTSKASQKIDSSTTAYVDLYLVGVTTNNGVITAKAYSGITTQVGTDLTYTRLSSDPAMSLSNGTSAHGIIKMASAANVASYVDDLYVVLDS